LITSADYSLLPLCLRSGLCVCKISQKLMNGFWSNFLEGLGVAQGRIDPDSFVDPGITCQDSVHIGRNE